MPRLLSLVSLAIVCFSSRPAFGAEPPSPSPTPSDESPPFSHATDETTWYGWQTLIADALSIGVAAATQGEAATVGSIGYLAGAPIIHATHGNLGKGAGSVGLRFGLPVVGGGIGVAISSCNGLHGYCGLEAFAVGALSGMGAAIAIDSAVLAYERRPPRPLPRVLPNFVLVRGGAVATASGSF
jgi:hypothetical protein